MGEHTRKSTALDLYEFGRRAAAQMEHERNLRGRTAKVCAPCSGSGEESPAYIDYDAHGSQWVPATPCRSCGGARTVELPCTWEQEAAAIRREIEALQKRLNSRRKR